MNKIVYGCLESVHILKSRMKVEQADDENLISLPDTCSKLSLIRDELKLRMNSCDNGFGSPEVSNYLLDLVVKDVDNTIAATLKQCSSQIGIMCSAQAVATNDLTALVRTLKQMIKKAVTNSVCKEYVIAGVYQLSGLVVTQDPAYPYKVHVEFYSRAGTLFTVQFVRGIKLWTCGEDISEKYLAALNVAGCKTAKE